MKIFLYIIVLTIITACTAPTTGGVPTSLKEQKLETEFKDEGIKLFYTFTGKIEKIEIFGQADAWKGEFDTLAEADALAKLVKFIYGSEVNTQRRVKILTYALEKAGDTSKINDENNTSSKTDQELEEEFTNIEKKNNYNSEITDHSLRQAASRINKNIMETITTITAKGRLTGVRKVRDSQTNNGKTYSAVYQWSDKDQSAAESISDRMKN